MVKSVVEAVLFGKVCESVFKEKVVICDAVKLLDETEVFAKGVVLGGVDESVVEVDIFDAVTSDVEAEIVFFDIDELVRRKWVVLSDINGSPFKAIVSFDAVTLVVIVEVVFCDISELVRKGRVAFSIVIVSVFCVDVKLVAESEVLGSDPIKSVVETGVVLCDTTE